MIPRHVVLLVLAILAAGFAAASKSSSLLWLTAPAVAGMMLAESRRAMRVGADYAAFPDRMRRHVETTMAQLPAGEARALLSRIVAHARPAFERPDATFDARENESTRADVAELVDACCTTAMELARLDVLSPRSTARALFVSKLDEAASALEALYDADVRQGTPASDRVGELAAEIKADAQARSRAKEDLRGLLGG